MANFDWFQDLFKPVLLAALGAIVYFLRVQFNDLKAEIAKINTTLGDVSDKYVKKVDCDKHVQDCTQRRREIHGDCEEDFRRLKNTTSKLVGCVNRYVKDCPPIVENEP